MKTVSKVCSVLAVLWFVAAAIVWVACMGSIWWKDGFWKVCEILSPFNFLNFLATLAFFAPGFFFGWLAERAGNQD